MMYKRTPGLDTWDRGVNREHTRLLPDEIRVQLPTVLL